MYNISMGENAIKKDKAEEERESDRDTIQESQKRQHLNKGLLKAGEEIPGWGTIKCTASAKRTCLTCSENHKEEREPRPVRAVGL